MKSNHINQFNKNIFLLSFFLIGICSCEKESTSVLKLNNDYIKDDDIFTTYINETKDLNNHLSNRKNIIDVSENDFLTNYTLAIKNDNYEAKRYISNLMGYDEMGFWDNRKKRLGALWNLNQKYYLSNLTIEKFYMTNKIRSNMMELIDCGEMYKNCQDGVTANYAMDQITCVAAGALGWTGVGALLFVGCEAAANYKMYVGDRNCRINFKNCK